jgi:excisionase family DNA binding protein
MVERLSYRPAEVREMIGIGRTKLQELLSTGQIESFSVGRARLISRGALERWLSQRAQTVTAVEADPDGGAGDTSGTPTAIVSTRRERWAPSIGSVKRSAITTSETFDVLRQGE